MERAAGFILLQTGLATRLSGKVLQGGGNPQGRRRRRRQFLASLGVQARLEFGVSRENEPIFRRNRVIVGVGGGCAERLLLRPARSVRRVLSREFWLLWLPQHLLAALAGGMPHLPLVRDHSAAAGNADQRRADALKRHCRLRKRARCRLPTKHRRQLSLRKAAFRIHRSARCRRSGLERLQLIIVDLDRDALLQELHGDQQTFCRRAG